MTAAAEPGRRGLRRALAGIAWFGIFHPRTSLALALLLAPAGLAVVLRAAGRDLGLPGAGVAAGALALVVLAAGAGAAAFRSVDGAAASAAAALGGALPGLVVASPWAPLPGAAAGAASAMLLFAGYARSLAHGRDMLRAFRAAHGAEGRVVAVAALAGAAGAAVLGPVAWGIPFGGAGALVVVPAATSLVRRLSASRARPAA